MERLEIALISGSRYPSLTTITLHLSGQTALTRPSTEIGVKAAPEDAAVFKLIEDHHQARTVLSRHSVFQDHPSKVSYIL